MVWYDILLHYIKDEHYLQYSKAIYRVISHSKSASRSKKPKCFLHYIFNCSFRALVKLQQHNRVRERNTCFKKGLQKLPRIKLRTLFHKISQPTTINKYMELEKIISRARFLPYSRLQPLVLTYKVDVLPLPLKERQVL